MLFPTNLWQSGASYHLPSFTLLPYALPLARPYIWAKGKHFARSGIIVSCNLASHTGYGEIAPAPHLTCEPESYFAQAREALHGFNAEKENLILQLNERRICPRLRCGLVSAWLCAQADAHGVPLADRLGEMFGQIPLSQVPVNALISSLSAAECEQDARRLAALGFGVIKIKLLGDLSQDLERVAAVRRALPSMRLRLDANGCWSEREAHAQLVRFEELQIDYIEDPLPMDAPVESLLQLKASTSIMIALDERADSLAAIEKLLKAKAMDHLIVKNQRLGGPDIVLQAASLAEQYQVLCTLTGSLESAVGLLIGLHTASVLPAPLHACGIGTAEYFKQNVCDFPHPLRGDLQVPSGPGLGL